MEKEMNTGGPAFPRPHSGATQYAQEGMTLRDYFAAKAMQASICDATRQPAYAYADKAEYAYEMADAMLKAREE
jgi:hypothetical protein